MSTACAVGFVFAFRLLYQVVKVTYRDKEILLESWAVDYVRAGAERYGSVLMFDRLMPVTILKGVNRFPRSQHMHQDPYRDDIDSL